MPFNLCYILHNLCFQFLLGKRVLWYFRKIALMVGAFRGGFQTLTLFKGNKLKIHTLIFKEK